MSLRIISRSIWKNPGNRGKRFWKSLVAVHWQFHKRVIGRPRSITLANGVRFRAHPDCVVSSALHYADWPEFHELAFCRRHLRAGDAVFDVGANVGHFSLLLADVVGPENLFCFEPTPVTCERLKANFELNGWPTDRIYSLAVAAAEGEVEFPDSSSPETTNSAVWSRPDVRKTTVGTRPLDAWLTELSGRPVGLLKIDVEGFEPEVFLGARRFFAETRPRLVMFESLDRALDKSIAEILRAARFGVFKLDDQGLPVSGTLDAQNLFATPDELRAQIMAPQSTSPPHPRETFA